MNFLFRTDVHISDHKPASWKADYLSELWSSLEQIGDIARKYKVEAVLDGGDYFHVKAATRNSHALVARSAEIQAGYPCPTYSIEGNHDISYNNLASIEKQPLGVLYASQTFKKLREEVFIEGNIRVRVVGVPYSPHRTLEDFKAIKKKEGDTHLIVVAHALAGENPPANLEEYFGEPVFRYSDLVFKDGPDAYCFGHWHKDQGVSKVNGVQFINQGAVSRGSLTKENLERTPQVTLIEVGYSGLVTSIIPLRVLPASEVFDVERKQRQEEEGKSIDQFAEKLAKDFLIDSSIPIEDNIARMAFASEVRERALVYLQNAREKA